MTRRRDDQWAGWLRPDGISDAAGGEEASCHVGYRSCFYREVSGSGSDQPELRFIESEKAFDPDAVYGDTPNPTQL